MRAGKSSLKCRNNGNRNGGLNSTYDRLEARTLLAAYIPGEVLVQHQWGQPEQGLFAARTVINAQLLETIHTVTMKSAGVGPLERLQLPIGMSVEAAVQTLSHVAGVLYAEPNYVYQHTAISNDTRYLNGTLWGMYSDDLPTPVGPSGTTNVFGSQAEKAWDVGYTGSHSIVIGVIDEGIQITHPDLAANIWVNPFEIPNDGIDNDGNGYIDDVNGWDFYNNDKTVYDGTSDDHGTHVAGTIGGVGGNGLGVAGVNWNVTMVSLKFLGAGGGTTSNAVKAIDYLTDLKTRHGLNVVASNNSWGGTGNSQALLDAIVRGAQQQIVFVAAAGNAGTNNDSSPFYPANYNTTSGAGWDAVISVANITSSGNKASTSNYGLTTVDLGAPGSAIWSTVPNNSYASYGGTSMAAPHVTGAVALYRSAVPNATGLQTRNAILQNTTATSSMSGRTVTGGRLDVWKIMNSVPNVPDININNVSIVEGNSGSSQLIFTVTLSVATSTTVTVNYATADDSATAGSDYQAASGTVTFNPGVTSQPIAITVFGDTAIEPDETFFVHLSNAVGGNIVGSPGVGTIVNDDTEVVPDIWITDVTMNEGDSGTKNFTFKIKLSEATTKTVKVNFATANGTAIAGEDYEAKSGTVSVSPGATTKNVVIVVYGDLTIEPDETFFVNLSNPVNGNLIDSQGVGTISNDDFVLPNITINDVTANEGNSGSKTFTFKVKLSEPSTQTVKVSFQTADGTATAGEDYQAATGTITFPAGVVTKNLNVTVFGDTTPELNETFFVNLFNPVKGVITRTPGVGTIKNDDGSMSPPALRDGAAGSSGDPGWNPLALVRQDGDLEVRVAAIEPLIRRDRSTSPPVGLPSMTFDIVPVSAVTRTDRAMFSGRFGLLQRTHDAKSAAEYELERLTDREFETWDDRSLIAF